MNDFLTQLPTTLRHLEEIEAVVDQRVIKLHQLEETVGQLIPPLETWTIPSDLLGWDHPMSK